MRFFSKKISIIISIITVVLIAGFSCWFIFKKAKPLAEKEIPKEEITEKEVLVLMAEISEINIQNNILAVKPIKEDREIKVILSKNTEIIKLEFPFNLSNPPEKEFTLKKKELKISELKKGDTIFIKTEKDITGKNEFDDVSIIEVLP